MENMITCIVPQIHWVDTLSARGKLARVQRRQDETLISHALEHVKVLLFSQSSSSSALLSLHTTNFTKLVNVRDILNLVNEIRLNSSKMDSSFGVQRSLRLLPDFTFPPLGSYFLFPSKSASGS